jgi:hypothetical protein
MRRWQTPTGLCLLLGLGGADIVAAADPQPDQTRQALAALFAASSEIIPPASSCHGDYGQRGRARIGDLLSMEFAYLYRGENVVTGQCAGDRAKHCSVSIVHAFGEDVSSARIDFTIRGGRLSVGTLACVITP